MAKKKAVKKAVGGKSKASSAKHIVPNGFWQQVLALLALVFAGILFLAIAGIGGGAPNEIFKALRSLVGLIAFTVPFIVVYLALKRCLQKEMFYQLVCTLVSSALWQQLVRQSQSLWMLLQKLKTLVEKSERF